MLLVVTTGVVVVTLVVQGSTLAPLVRRLGVTTPFADAAADIVRAEHALAVAALNQLEDAADAVGAARPVVDAVRRELQSQADSSRPDEPSTPPDGAAQALRRELLATQSAELTRLRVAGEISADTFRRLQRRLDIDHTRLRE
jgi:CPA1 family monovalent cation:H+ antiporter